MAYAYAVLMTEANYGAIASENPKFNLGEARQWVEEHGPSFFIRDEERRAFDCRYMTETVFHQIYAFDGFRPNDIFHKLIRL